MYMYIDRVIYYIYIYYICVCRLCISMVAFLAVYNFVRNDVFVIYDCSVSLCGICIQREREREREHV